MKKFYLLGLSLLVLLLAQPTGATSSTTTTKLNEQNTSNTVVSVPQPVPTISQTASTYDLSKEDARETENAQVEGASLDGVFRRAKAQKKDNGLHSYVQNFQNNNVSLTGTSVRASMYFTRIDYWQLKSATLNLTFEVSQLANTQESDLTLSLNGVKFYSFRPNHTKGRQMIKVALPLDLIQDSNVLTVQGQIINLKGARAGLMQTPANWLTIYKESNVNFEFDLMLPTHKISSFYNHFIGEDTIANEQSTILVSPQASEKELEAATYALSGLSRLITNENSVLPLHNFQNRDAMKKPYRLIIASYSHLPTSYQKKIKETEVQNDQACLRFFREKKRYTLVATAKDEVSLIKAGRYIANEELMRETAKANKIVTPKTDTFTSDLQFNGNYPLKSNQSQLIGPNHQEQVYFVNIPRDQTNSDGSYVNINFRYADNLDFSNSLVTVYVNNKPIGSKKLTKEKANGDRFRVAIPKNTVLANSFVIKVAFDLNLKSQTNNTRTPWAYIENDSNAYIRTMDNQNVLFSNYPSIFISNRSFNNIGVQLPRQLKDEYLQVLGNIFNLIGNYAERNVGDITFYKGEMSESELASHNMITFGTYKDNALIRRLNDDLYFRFNAEGTAFVSNEKLSVESDYGKQIGVDQLLFNPYNKEKALLVVSGADAKDVLLASSQIDSQMHAAMYKGDAIVIDTEGQRYDYRFKKDASYEQKISLLQKIKANPYLTSFVITAILGLGLVLFIFILLIRKYKGQGNKRKG